LLSRSELDDDVLGVAAPIRGDGGSVVAAVSVAAVASRVSAEFEHEIVTHVCAGAERISERLTLVSG
jgi:DNA-binding IclR family transcriptional regulator